MPQTMRKSLDFPTIIGLTGPKACGKDTVAQLLEMHFAGTHLCAFADPLRMEVMEAFHIDAGLLTRPETKEHPITALALHRCLDADFVAAAARWHSMQSSAPLDMHIPRSPRQIMQLWGTEYRRAQHANYWVQQCVARISQLINLYRARMIVITDVRMPDEAEMVHKLGGEIWQITRPGCNASADTHSSETTGAMFQPRHVLNNCHDMRHLHMIAANAACESMGVPA